MTAVKRKRVSTGNGAPLLLIFFILFAMLTVVEFISRPWTYFTLEHAGEELPLFLGFFAWVNHKFYWLLGLAGMAIPPLLSWVLGSMLFGKWKMNGRELFLRLLPIFLLGAVSFASFDLLFLDNKYYLGGWAGLLVVRWMPANIWVWPVFLAALALFLEMLARLLIRKPFWVMIWQALGTFTKKIQNLSNSVGRSRAAAKDDPRRTRQREKVQKNRPNQDEAGVIVENSPKATTATSRITPVARPQEGVQGTTSHVEETPGEPAVTIDPTLPPLPRPIEKYVEDTASGTEKPSQNDPRERALKVVGTEQAEQQEQDRLLLDLKPSQVMHDLPGAEELGELPTMPAMDREDLPAIAEVIEKKCRELGVAVQVDPHDHGPVVNTFRVVPRPGVKINRIKALANDLKLSLGRGSVRFSEPKKGQSYLICEVPCEIPEDIYYQDILAKFNEDSITRHPAFLLGVDLYGKPASVSLDALPHLLIAGATNSGKSVFLNSVIVHLLLHYTASELRMVLIDMKSLEFSPYEPAPHLAGPVITDVRDAESALDQLLEEMEWRYKFLKKHQVRDINEYRQDCFENDVEPQICRCIVIIDELADLLMVGGEQVQQALVRLAQKARAVGIHLVVATQRPSVDVVSGILKANFPTRIAFQVSSAVDSRVILDAGGAEFLIGRGDFLIMHSGKELQRMHSGLVSTEEVRNFSKWWKKER